MTAINLEFFYCFTDIQRSLSVYPSLVAACQHGFKIISVFKVLINNYKVLLVVLTVSVSEFC